MDLRMHQQTHILSEMTYCDLSVWNQTLKSDKSGQTFSTGGVWDQILKSPSQSDIQSLSDLSKSDPQSLKSVKILNQLEFQLLKSVKSPKSVKSVKLLSE